VITQSDLQDKPLAILNSALKLFAEYGFHGTPTSKIASEAGIAHGTIFHYYKTKDELVAALYEHIKSDLRKYLTDHIKESDSLKERFRDLFYYSVQWSLEHREEFYFTQQFKYSPHLKNSGTEDLAQQQSLHRKLYKEALQTKTFKPLSIDLISSIAMSQMVGTYNYLADANLPAKKQSTIITDTFEMLWSMFENPDQG
jgi:AcrR family transcriptional regulator